MSAITHIGTVLVSVADQDAALGFWHELGFETRIDGAFGAAAAGSRSRRPARRPPSPWSRGSRVRRSAPRSASRPRTLRPTTLRCCGAASTSTRS